MEPEPSSSGRSSDESWPTRKGFANISPNLVGSIVEKVFSIRTGQQKSRRSSIPEPTVLPFPVARHRSHGPHWMPPGREGDVEDKEDMDIDEEDIDLNSIADFVQPILRKPKKGLDFSKWKELMATDRSATTQENKMDNLVSVETREGKMEKHATDIEIRRNMGRATFPNSDAGNLENRKGKLPPFHGEDLTRSGDTPGISSSIQLLDSMDDTEADVQKRNTPYMNEIDAENNALLQQMSPNEIADAQKEIMKNMQPGILEMFKKRGREKSEKRKGLTSDTVMGCQPSAMLETKHLGTNSTSAPLLQSAVSDTSIATRSCKNSSRASTGSWWEIWSNRVEAAGKLRFSLDGTVVGKDSIQMASNDYSQYNAGNVTERDFLRTEGDPGAAGYTIKEAVALVRSMLPGQRVLALQILTSVLDKALCNLQQSYAGCNEGGGNHVEEFVDWQAIWAYALGPEPELLLSLRMALDDNHVSVIFACANAIHCILTCDKNENFINLSENFATSEKEICTAPVFRSKPEVDAGFLKGGFWKYNAKSSNILLSNDEDVDDDSEEKATIQDDIAVAGQDIAAGLVRMGILPRIRYVLEVDQLDTVEECLLSILIALARHSPACANAIIKCPRLVETVINRFIKKEILEFHPSEIKSVNLLRVLAQSNKQTCMDLTKHGVFQHIVRHLYNLSPSGREYHKLDHWLRSGREYCKLVSAMLIEQLRFWKVCVHYGCFISYFADFFPVICFWLGPPTFEKLVEANIFCEFASITREAYLTLATLARRLPTLHGESYQKEICSDSSGDDTETWSWSHVVPIVEIAMKWISFKNDPYLSIVFNHHEIISDHVISSLLWVISSVIYMLSNIFEKIIPPEGVERSQMPWLPEFVPKVALGIVENALLRFSSENSGEYEKFPTGRYSFVENLCYLRNRNNQKISLASVCCLGRLVKLMISVDKSMKMCKCENFINFRPENGFTRDEKILDDGIVERSRNELRRVLTFFLTKISLEWLDVESIEMFGRGGPAPGIGVGWGASGGGFWSTTVLLAQADAQLTLNLLEIFPIVVEKDVSQVEGVNLENNRSLDWDETVALQRINSSLGICLVLGPSDVSLMEKTLDFLLGIPALKYLNFCMHQLLHHTNTMRPFAWDYKEEDFICFSKVLNAHFRSRWLNIKKLKDRKANKKNRKEPKRSDALATIHEDSDVTDQTTHTCLVIEWAHQRLPLPVHWFLSPLSTVTVENQALQDSTIAPIDVARSGLFFLLGVEALSSRLGSSDVRSSPVLSIPLAWKLHALSTVLLGKIDVLEEEKSREVFEALQNYYGQLLDKSHCANIESDTGENYGTEILKFQTDIHENYSTFVENLVEQFCAISFGDMLYGRQVAVYLHHAVEVPVRLSAWNALSNAHGLELLPAIGDCFAKAEGYLTPNEDNEVILEAYVNSWISGKLDKAADRGSITYALARHHLSCFIFLTEGRKALKNKLVKSLLRDYSRKRQHEGMLLDLIQYESAKSQQRLEGLEVSIKETMERRFELLSEACEGSSSLLAEVEKLKSSKTESFMVFPRCFNGPG